MRACCVLARALSRDSSHGVLRQEGLSKRHADTLSGDLSWARLLGWPSVSVGAFDPVSLSGFHFELNTGPMRWS